MAISTIGKNALDNASNGAGTGALVLPAGTTAQRPGTAVTGQQRYNTSVGYVEVYNGTAWVAVGDQSATYSVDYLVVAGGGGGGGGNGSWAAGGGGAGGYLTSSLNIVSTTT